MAYSPIRVAKPMSGANPPTAAFPPATGSTFALGQMVILDGDGKVAIAGGDNPSAVLGVALEAAVDENSGVLRTRVTVALGGQGTVFSVPISSGSFSQGVVGDLASYDLSDNGIVIGTAGNGTFQIVGADEMSTGRCLVTIPYDDAQIKS